MVKDKRIVIWGTGNTGNDFYRRYKELIDLNICTDSNEKAVPIDGTEYVKYEELDSNRDFIIICSIYHEEIERRLYIDGWRSGIHYMTSNLFEAKMETKHGDKKLLVSIGRCHIGRIAGILNRIPVFHEKYQIIHFAQPQVCVSEEGFDYNKLTECMEMLNSADILLRPATVTASATKDYACLEEMLPDKCRVIKVSLPMFGSYWPQDKGSERSTAKWYVPPFRKVLKSYSERDYVIEELMESGKSKKEIMDIISDENLFDRQKVCANHDKVMKNAYFWDRISDVKIADFIEANYKTKKLYCDRGHIHTNLLKEYVRRILIALNETNSLDEVERETLYETSELSLPPDSLIYPSTVKALGLKFMDDEPLYRFQLADGSRMVTFSEGLEMQIEYYMRARSLLEMCYVNK